MKFECETIYNQKAFTEMAKALRKTVRKKMNMRSRFFGWLIVILAIFLLTPPEGQVFVFDLRVAITLLAVVAIIVVFIFEDRINGYTARKRMLAGTEKTVAVFEEDGYKSSSDFGKSEWTYDKINMIAESKNYFVFIFSISHAQVYEKAKISGGTVDDFRKFITQKTGKEIQKYV